MKNLRNIGILLIALGAVWLVLGKQMTNHWLYSMILIAVGGGLFVRANFAKKSKKESSDDHQK